jgi:hypothetical protein
MNMAMEHTPLVVGVFDADEKARRAIDELKDAGFGYDQVGVATQHGGAPVNNLRDDLMHLGVPKEQATFYDNEFKSGHTVISIRPDGRDEEASNILHRNGAYDYPGAFATEQPPHPE